MSYLANDQFSPGETIRRMVPSATVFLSMLVMTLPMPFAWGVMPNLALLFVIIWSSLQPRLMPSWAAFGLGLFADLLFGGPIGVWALLYPACAIAVGMAESRAEGHSLNIDWAFASVLLILAQLLCWQFLHFTGWEAPLLPLMVQVLITILAYPLAAVVAGRIQRRLIDVQG
ncbi:rod shape-determining protein MreD [Sandaracinobacteroides hominis]|uniref:rod shape-determining protein MreD n=1 Tax=Sandaracinobacteroides hominis TaxID=2780086 RepID=UPI0018F677B0|nr:rod shape-determining protein MreD [Sandaracinobacteroides hominis]